MPIMTDTADMQDVQFDGGAFTFSAVRPDSLGATEYTLVSIVVDRSGSVWDFENQLMQGLRDAVKACEKSPRADNLLVRYTNFNHALREVHGFETLRTIDPSKYKGLNPYGTTALYDATYDAVKATVEYGKILAGNDFDVNAIVFVLTDGMDNNSSKRMEDVKRAIEEALKAEQLESIITILIGVNQGDRSVEQYLKSFKDTVGFTQYVPIDSFDDKQGAKLAAFISKSTSSQAGAMGTGGPSKTLAF